MLKDILRIVIGLIFIISGGVKSIDPVGFSFKLEEYFSPSVFNLPFLVPYTLFLAIFVVFLEFLLGLFLILKVYFKFSLWTLIAMCVFFGFLTFYSAFYNVVTDCGCFGDAIKFTPWQSFWKDIILLLGLILLWKLYQKSGDWHQKVNQKHSFVITILGIIMIRIIRIGIDYEPVVDFRDYKIGTDLVAEKQKIAQNPNEYQLIYPLKNLKNGQEIEVNQEDYINQNYWENPDWEILTDKTKTKIIKQGYSSAIEQFVIENENGQDITDSLLTAKRSVLIFSYKNNDEITEKIRKLENHLDKEKGVIYGISPELGAFTKIPNATMDATAIKTIARSNPFFLTLENGKIIQKGNLKDFEP